KQVFAWQTEDLCLYLVNGVNVLQYGRVVVRRLAVPLAFIIREIECLVFDNGSAQRCAKLILLQFIEASGSGEQILGVHLVVTEIFVDRTVQSVGPALRNDVNDSSYSAPELCAVAAVHHAEFLDGFL